jgi:phosphoribosylaminoimidazole carboxylase
MLRQPHQLNQKRVLGNRDHDRAPLVTPPSSEQSTSAATDVLIYHGKKRANLQRHDLGRKKSLLFSATWISKLTFTVETKMSPNPVIGLLGGGQLGRMLCEAAAPLDIQIAVLDAENAPAKQISQNRHHINGSYKDAEKIRELATHCGVLSVETEHIDTTVLEEIATCTKVAVHPSWRTLRLIQDKYEQKAYLGDQGIPIAEQTAIEASGDAMHASLQDVSTKFGFPWMLKARKDSYDGRGNLKISSEADLERAVAGFGNIRCYAEKYVPFERELSVLVIRTEDGEGRTKRLVPYPAVETVHEDNICSRVFMPPRATPVSVCKRAQQVACSVVDKLWGRGVFAVETFVTKDNEILVNEVAPRPHNSGHLFTEAVPYM